MANEEHSALTGSSLHENKGVSSASDNTVLTVVSGATVCAKLTASNLTGTGNPFGASLLHVQDEKASGDDGGSFTSGAWRTRTLNTVKTNEITSASLTSNVISLPAGTYHVRARAPANNVGGHQIKLVTGATDLVLGTNGKAVTSISGGTGNVRAETDSILEGRFTIGITSNIELQHRCTASATDGFGVSTGWGTEVYAQVYIWKVL